MKTGGLAGKSVPAKIFLRNDRRDGLLFALLTEGIMTELNTAGVRLAPSRAVALTFSSAEHFISYSSDIDIPIAGNAL
jgi:hypothetical protein